MESPTLKLIDRQDTDCHRWMKVNSCSERKFNSTEFKYMSHNPFRVDVDMQRTSDLLACDSPQLNLGVDDLDCQIISPCAQSNKSVFLSFQNYV